MTERCANCGYPLSEAPRSAVQSETLPEIPDDDADFTPDLARKIIAKYQAIISMRNSDIQELSLLHGRETNRSVDLEMERDRLLGAAQEAVDCDDVAAVICASAGNGFLQDCHPRTQASYKIWARDLLAAFDIRPKASPVPSATCQCQPLTRYADAPHDEGCPLSSTDQSVP